MNHLIQSLTAYPEPPIFQIQKEINRLRRLIRALWVRYKVRAQLFHDELFMDCAREQMEEVSVFVHTFKGVRTRKWRMVYGWRNNPVAASMHFASAALFTNCAHRAAKLADRFPIFESKRSEAQVKAMFETAAGHAALVDRWVRVGSKHRWEVK